MAKDRITAAVEAARSLSFPFTLTARAENHFTGDGDLADSIKRLQVYQEAGADVRYAPGLRSKADIASVIASVDRPINVLRGPKEGLVPIAELAEMGVRRISLGARHADHTSKSAAWRTAGYGQSIGRTPCHVERSRRSRARFPDGHWPQ